MASEQVKERLSIIRRSKLLRKTAAELGDAWNVGQSAGKCTH
jgi:hypothetical protein